MAIKTFEFPKLANDVLDQLNGGMISVTEFAMHILGNYGIHITSIHGDAFSKCVVLDLTRDATVDDLDIQLETCLLVTKLKI